MPEPLVRMLDAVRIDEDRQYIEFCFKDGQGGEQAIQVDFSYVESLAALFQQAYVSAALEEQQGRNRWVGRQHISVPRVEIDHPVSVAVDLMADRIVTMFLLGTPFQTSFTMPTGVARMLSGDLLTACEAVDRQVAEVGRPAN